MKTVCQNTDKTINNNCLVSPDKTLPAGGGQTDTDKPPVQSRPESRLESNGGEEEAGGAGGRGVNGPRHHGVLRNKTSDRQADREADNTRQQFENIQGQLEVQTPSQFNILVFAFFFVKISFEMIIFEGCQEKAGGSIKRAAED